MAKTNAVGGKLLHFIVIKHGTRHKPAVVLIPPDLLDVLAKTTLICLETVVDVLLVFCQVGEKTDLRVLSSQLGSGNHA